MTGKENWELEKENWGGLEAEEENWDGLEAEEGKLGLGAWEGKLGWVRS